MILKYGDAFEIDTDTLPETSVTALLQRGINHYFGNEQAAKVSNMRKKAEADGEEFSDDQAESALAGFRADAMTALEDGTIGSRSGGPKLRGLEKFVFDVAVGELRVHAAKKNVKWPSGKGAAERIAGLVGQWMANAQNAARVRAEAQRQFDAQQAVGDIDFNFGADAA